MTSKITHYVCRSTACGSANNGDLCCQHRNLCADRHARIHPEVSSPV